MHSLLHQQKSIDIETESHAMSSFAKNARKQKEKTFKIWLS